MAQPIVFLPPDDLLEAEHAVAAVVDISLYVHPLILFRKA